MLDSEECSREQNAADWRTRVLLRVYLRKTSKLLRSVCVEEVRTRWLVERVVCRARIDASPAKIAAHHATFHYC